MTDNKIKDIKENAKICCIGHITKDRVITPRFAADMPGGTAYYFAKALRRLKHDNFLLVTSVAEDSLPVVEELKGEGLAVEVIPSRQTVCFENKYGDDMNSRTQRVLAKADPFTAANLQSTKSDIFHLGTLLADDFATEVIKDLSGRGVISVDVQGYLRAVEGESVKAVDYKEKLEALPHIDILKANEHEMETLTGTSDPREAARILSGWGVREVLLTLGDKGSLIYRDGIFHDIPAYPVENPVDATGCGDTYMAGYLYKRAQSAGIDEAGRFAAAMCSLKLAEKGPFDGTEEDVMRLINQ
ncbi:MAG: ribokinase [Muribaculaceae bacterium]|nr:ribokinase [Muribaculaceae bacterium]